MLRDRVLKVLRKHIQIFTHSNESLFNTQYSCLTKHKGKKLSYHAEQKKHHDNILFLPWKTIDFCFWACSVDTGDLCITRNNNISVKLPKVKLQVARRSYFFMSAKIYNALPRNVRKITSFNQFKHILKLHF